MTDLDDRSLDIAERLERRSASLTVGVGSLSAVQRRARQRSQHRVAMVGATGVLVAAGAVAVRLRSDGDTKPNASIAPATTTSVANAQTTTLRKGDHGPDVVHLQQQLLQLGIFPGPSDGNFSTLTEQAVWAAEGWLLHRPVGQQTGVVDATLWSALDSTAPAPRRPGSGTHVEIDLPTQVLVVWADDKPALVTHVSTGTGERWCETQTVDVDVVGRLQPATTNNVCGVATTPGGAFKVYRALPGTHNSALGRITDALFFNYTINIAGAIDVPRNPSSHGGVKVPNTVQQRLIDLVHVGDKVLVWNGTTEPESVSRKDAFPVWPFPDPSVTTTTTG
jgi:peptidoglycan hydrolase-like protein with peptidoglycan-binding domain